MTPRLYLELLLLSAIWGSSFIFMRVLAPNIGALMTAEVRMLLGGAGLMLWFIISGFDAQWKRFWRRYLLIGLMNTAIPFSLFAYAALTIPGSYSAILNSLAPLWGALFSAWFLKDALTWRKVAGLALGMIGVALIARAGPVELNRQTLLAMGACIAATVCYGACSVYIKLKLHDAKPAAIAGGSQMLAALVFLPVLWSGPATANYTPSVLINITVLSLVCGSFAYLLYYRLATLAGPIGALSVTFLIPLFGILWAHLFLGEAITPGIVAGCALVLAGLALLFARPVPTAPAAPDGDGKQA